MKKKSEIKQRTNSHELTVWSLSWEKNEAGTCRLE